MADSSSEITRTFPVYLVGAGPGDPDLLTLKARKVLEIADVIIYDRLVHPDLLLFAKPGVQLIDVGKRPGFPFEQEKINELLIIHAQSGQVVARLKGGDPYVYGRGGEEAQALIEANIAFEVIPGITAAIAAPMSAGVPVTHRGLSASFTVVTGHAAVDGTIDWESVGKIGGTVVVMMGVANREEIASRLIKGGMDPKESVVAIRYATHENQQVWRTTLEELKVAEIDSPATIVIGKVASLDLLGNYVKYLENCEVVVTRDHESANPWIDALQLCGAKVKEIPLVDIVEPDDGGRGLLAGAKTLHEFEWVVFTSANAVEKFVPYLHDARDFSNTKIAAVGPKTKAMLNRFGIEPDLIPLSPNADGILEIFPSCDQKDRENPPGVFWPSSSIKRQVLIEGFVKKGYEVVAVDAYKPVEKRLSEKEISDLLNSDIVTFAAPSAIKSAVNQCSSELLGKKIVCIGPITAKEASEQGFQNIEVADTISAKSLVEAVIKSWLRN